MCASPSASTWKVSPSSGVSARSSGASPESWATGRRRLEADVVAVCEVLLAGGASELILLDNHGGNTVNFAPEVFPPRARTETWQAFYDLLGYTRSTPCFRWATTRAAGSTASLAEDVPAGPTAAGRRRADLRKPRPRMGCAGPTTRHHGQRPPPGNARLAGGDALPRRTAIAGTSRDDSGCSKHRARVSTRSARLPRCVLDRAFSSRPAIIAPSDVRFEANTSGPARSSRPCPPPVGSASTRSSSAFDVED